MNNPKISVIIPVYNNTILIKKCLNSILNQTLKEIEVICVNDGSTDNTSEVLHRLSEQDNRIKVIDKENEWQSYARKVGIDNAKGEYIMFCDHDDEYSSNTSFEEIYNKAKATDVDIVSFDFYFKNGNNAVVERKFLPNPPKKEIFNYRDIENIYKSDVDLWLLFIKRNFLKKYNDWYFPKKMYYEDTPLHFQLLFRASTMCYLEKPFYKYYLNESSATYLPKTNKRFRDSFLSTKFVFDFMKKENIEEKFVLQFFFYILSKLPLRLERAYLNVDNANNIIDSINLFNIEENNYDELVYKEFGKKKIFYIYKAVKRLKVNQFCDYINKRQLQEQNKKLQEQNKKLQEQNKKIYKQIELQDQQIKRLQNSWSYRIGRLITYPLLIPLEFYKFIRDYNLLKKSDLFDSEYYLANNEDVKKAKMNPIKHYLKFGWKEGRNPSIKFNGNDYLNKRPDVRIDRICPLIHYLKFRKDKK